MTNTHKAILAALSPFALAAALLATAPPPRPAYLPDPRLTPGAVLPVRADETCDPGYAVQARNVPKAMKVAVCQAYRVAYDASAFEIDHVIPVACGGASVPANLFPMPWAGKYGARSKDALEFWAHREVCAKRMTLGAAQALFLPDWTVAFDRVFPNGIKHKVGAPMGESGDAEEYDTEGFRK